MMKFVVTALVAILVSMPSQAKMTSTERVFLHQKQYVSNSQMRTKSVLVLAVPKHQRKFVVTNELTDDSSDDLPGPDELDLQSPYARLRVTDGRKGADNNDVSDYVTVRLAVARAKALEKYRQTWA